MPLKKIFNISNLALVTALTLSAIAAWYSILGLTAIFAAAVIPIIIMGGSLELAKVVTTVWLHKYWDRAGIALKLYLVPAVITLALITSMGIFGFLSKAHLDQGMPTADVSAQISLLDEKIKTQRDNIQVQRENIEAARKALAQMDAQVSARLDRGTSESSAERSVQIRRQQAKERSALNKEISDAQAEIERINSKIASLNEERAPVASQLRKVEAEVGPVKYIAALIYGDNPDTNLLERAVRWVIIILVLVFDPLALCLVIAAISSRRWENEVEAKVVQEIPAPVVEPIVEESKVEEKVEPVIEKEPTPEPAPEPITEVTPVEVVVEPKVEEVVEVQEDNLKKKSLMFQKLKIPFQKLSNQFQNLNQKLKLKSLLNKTQGFISRNVALGLSKIKRSSPKE